MDDCINPRFTFHTILDRPLADSVDLAIRAWTRDLSPLTGEIAIEALEPARAATARIDLWVESLEPATCTYGFLISSADGNTPFARGERTVNMRWNPRNAELLKDLPAFA